MSVGQKNGNIDLVFAAIKQCGPMTMAEVMDYTGLAKQSVSRAFCDLVRETPRRKKRAYIKDWVYDHEGQRRYPRAVYAVGGGKDKPKPREPKEDIQRRHRQKKRMLRAVNSVFNLGLLNRGGYTRAPRKSAGNDEMKEAA